MTKISRKYNETNMCDRYGEDLTNSKPSPYREYKEGISTGKWLCNKCHMHDYNNEPNSHKNLLKSVAAFRNKQLSSKSEVGKGFIGEQIWCKYRGTKNCNLERDNFHSKEDSIDPEYGVVQIKLATLINGIWNIQFLNYDFDTAVILFMDDKSKNIERLCIIPVKELYGIMHLKIRKDGLYIKRSEAAKVCNKFYVSQNILDQINHVYHNLKIDDCPVLR